MKLSFFIVFVFVCQLFAVNTEAQTASIKLRTNNLSIEELFKEIENQTDYLVIYSTSGIRSNFDLSLTKKKANVSEYLDEALKGKGLKYEFINNYIILSKTEKSVNQENKVKIKGSVHDPAKEPVIGANIVEKGTMNGVITDAEGKFFLDVAPNATLVVSYIGYKTEEVTVTNKYNLSIILKEDSETLEEVVVVGYGTQKKVNLTGAVETISSKQIEGKPVTSLAEALAGESSGMSITQFSGQPGGGTGDDSNTTIRIRGVGTWGNADPLVLVDGISMKMSDVIPGDVESISILKDAASASIYGSRAANGVILITTKQGKKGKTSVSYNGNVGVQQAIGVPKMASSWEYAELYNQSMENEGKSSSLFPQDRIDRMKAGGDPDKLEGNTDWVSALIKPALQHSHNITLQGGSDKLSYNASLGYLNQDGIINSSYKRYNARINTSTRFYSWFKLGLNLAYINDESSESAADASWAYNHVLRSLPYMPVKFSNDVWSFDSSPKNPVRMASDEYGMAYKNGNKISFVATPEFNITKNLTVNGVFGYESNIYTFKRFDKTVYYDAFEPAGQSGNLLISRNQQTDTWKRYDNLTATSTVNYEKSINSHSFKVLLGGSLESFKYRYTTASRKDFPNNNFSEINAGDPNTAQSEGNSTYSSLASLFGRLNYSYKDKYLFEVNTRYDGSSKFAKGMQWGVFPSLSVGWRISEEIFFMNAKDIINNLKLRASWGMLGNQQIADYQSLSTYASGSSYIFDNISASYREKVMGNPLITWESSTNYNIGVDFNTFNNKLAINFDWYNRITDDILLQLEAPALLGIKPSMQNAGKVQNKGWEVNLNYRDKIGEDFEYSIGFNLSDVKNKVIDLKGYKSPSNNLTVRIEGEPIDALYGWETLGICTNQGDYEKYKDVMGSYYTNWGVGDLIINDRNNDGKISAEDKTVIGDQTPRFIYGLNLGFSYKNFDFSCFFQGVGKKDGFMGKSTLEPLGVYSVLKEHYTDSFNPQNPTENAYYPRMLNSSYHNYNNFSHWVQDASYLRLKNLQIAYNFKLEKMNIRNIRLIFSGQNLFTLTKFRVYDPESSINSVSFPNTKVFSFGVNLNF